MLRSSPAVKHLTLMNTQLVFTLTSFLLIRQFDLMSTNNDHIKAATFEPGSC